MNKGKQEEGRDKTRRKEHQSAALNHATPDQVAQRADKPQPENKKP